MGTIKDDEETPPETPEDLTKEFLTRALQREYGHDDEALPFSEVDSFEARNAEVGVLSHVVFVTCNINSQNNNNKKEQQFVAKFLKPEFPLQHMFEVESYFYRTVRPTVQSTSFHIPRPVVTSSSMIMMEFIPNATTFTAVQGCPAERVVPVATALGQWHAQFLNDKNNSSEDFYDKLASPPGIGSAASGMMKETQFPDMWKDFLDNIALLDNPLRSRMTEICQELSTRRLSLVHDTIHNHAVQTLIHGDCHVANMLFANDKIWLVDWAACGRGNPLIDLAFFTIVSLDPQVRKDTEEAMLQAYHKALGGVLSLDDCKKLYRTCLLNQFLILVIYDTMARGLVQQAKKPDELTHHFNVVNARACHALVEHYREEEMPRKKTPAEAAAKATELGDAKL